MPEGFTAELCLSALANAGNTYRQLSHLRRVALAVAGCSLSSVSTLHSSGGLVTSSSLHSSGLMASSTLAPSSCSLPLVPPSSSVRCRLPPPPTGSATSESAGGRVATSGSRTTAPPQQQQQQQQQRQAGNLRAKGPDMDSDMDSEFEESSDSDMEGSRSRDKGSKAKASSPLARDSSSEDGGLPEETVGGGGKRPRTADDAGNMGREDDADSAAASATMPRTQQRSTYESRRDADVHLNLVERVVFTNEELNRAGKGATAHHEGRKEGQHGETMHMRTRTHPLIAAVLPSLSRLSLTPHVHPTFSPPQAAGGQGASTPLMWIDGEWT